MADKRNGRISAGIGSLPETGPLASTYVPMQGSDPPRYDPAEALTRGTLFPGLDLPWKNLANKSNPYAGTPLGELMALSFSVRELGLYLDTHADDTEALRLFERCAGLLREGRERYVRLYGPLTQTDVTAANGWSWINDPWPWQYTERMGES